MLIKINIKLLNANCKLGKCFVNAKYVLSLILCALYTLSYGQNNKVENTNSKSIGINFDKVELIYKDVTVTEKMPSGNSYGYTLRIPRVKINNGVAQDYNGADMLKLFKYCPQAKKEVNLYLESKKYARIYSMGGLFLGSGLLFGGILTTAALNESGYKRTGIAFGTGFGLGVGTLIYGLLKGKSYRDKRDIHLRYSVEKYNNYCYQPIADTPKKEMVLDSIPQSNHKIAQEADRESKNTVDYELLRNNPAKLQCWNIGIIPVDFEFSNNRGFNMFYKVNIDILMSSKFGVNIDIKRAFVDNLSENTSKNKYTGLVQSMFPSQDYSPAFRSGFTISYDLKSKYKKGSTGTHLGYERMDGRQVEIVGTFKTLERVSYVLRGGYSYENAIFFGPDGLSIASSSTNVTYPDNLFGESPVPLDKIIFAMPMVKSNCLVVGIGRKKIFDYKIKLLNSKRFKGKRNSFGYSEWYGEIIYGYKLFSGEVVYQYPIRPDNESYGFSSPIKTDLTKYNKIGFRAGAYKVCNGFSMGFEISIRPGISTSQLNFGANCSYRFGSRF